MRRASYVTVVLIGSPAAFSGPLDGDALFVEKCLMCHGKGGMGAGLFSRRMQPAELLLRNDLPAAFVISVARAGLGDMPAVTRGEVSDHSSTPLRTIWRIFARAAMSLDWPLSRREFGVGSSVAIARVPPVQSGGRDRSAADRV